MSKYILLIMGLLLMLTASTAASALPEVSTILESMDEKMQLDSDGTARVEITQQKAGEGVKVYKSIYYVRDEDDSFLIIMTEPEAERGNGYLRVGDNFWLYKRNTRTFQHINRDESIAGSDASGEDFENRNYTDTYTAVLDGDGNEVITEEKLGDVPVYRIELEATTDDISYPKEVLWVGKENYLPMKSQSYSLNETLMQTAYYLKYSKIEGKYLCVKSMYIDEFDIGNKTLVEITDISVKEIDDHVFTKAYLESLSK
ncbi:MAG: outer membrane lipoprotein-sorting protein [Halanaerobiales bacterium]